MYLFEAAGRKPDVARRAGAAEARHLAAQLPARTAAARLSCHRMGMGRPHRGHGFGHVAARFTLVWLVRWFDWWLMLDSGVLHTLYRT